MGTACSVCRVLVLREVYAGGKGGQAWEMFVVYCATLACKDAREIPGEVPKEVPYVI